MLLLKIVFVLLGTIALALGVLGIFVPGLPTTPFLLLTAWLYVKSSERLYNMLLNTRFIGPYIKRYRKRRGMSMSEKIYSITLMWIMITLSVTLMIEEFWVRAVVVLLGLVGTVVMGFIIRTYREPPGERHLNRCNDQRESG